MNKSYWILIFLLMTACFGLKAQSPAPHKLLWEISGNELQTPSYLFGTMHVADSRVYNLPDSVFLAIQNSDGFALEIDFDTMSYSTFAYLYESQNGSTWGDVLNPEDAGEDISESGPDTRLLLDLLKFDKNDHPQEAASLDAFLYRLAKEYKKEITGLESIDEQLNLIADPESGLEESELDSTSSKPRRRLTLNRMIEIYEKGDLDLLDEYVNQPNPKGNFAQNVIIARNYLMAERADSLIKIRPTFLGVGAAHLPGKEGVINLLEARGYKLRPVKATYTGLNQKVREKAYQPHWQTFRRETEGYQLKVPTRPYSANQGDGDLSINIGMDLPGGIVFTYYAFSLRPGINSQSINKQFDKLEKSMRNKAYRITESVEKTYNGFPAREITGKKGKEYFRAQLVVANDFLYSMFWNGSEQVVMSPLTDEWFASLELFSPVPMSQQAKSLLEDPKWRYKINFPIERKTTQWSQETFIEGGSSALYTTVEANDPKNEQNITLHIEDYATHFQRGELEQRMEDCIYYFSEYALEPISDFVPISNGGIAGLQGEYLDAYGKSYTTRCFLDGNRLFFIGMRMKNEEKDSTALRTIFDSFELSPLQVPKLQHPYTHATFQVEFPEIPKTWIETEKRWLQALDTLEIAWSHDAASSLNFIATRSHISKYYSGTSDDLFTATKDFATADSQFIYIQSKFDIAGMPALKMYSRNHDSTLVDIYTLVVAGEHYIELDAQVPNTSAGRKLGEDFVKSLQIQPTAAWEQLGKGKLSVILKDIIGEDSLQSEVATDALYDYHFLEDEFPTAIESVLQYDLDSSNGYIATAIVYAMVENAEASAMPYLQKLAKLLKPNSFNKMSLLIKLLAEKDYNEWALSELAAVAKADAPIYNSGYSWQDYLGDEPSPEKVKPLLFLFDSKNLGLRFAYDMIVVEEEIPDAYYYHKFYPQAQKTLDIALKNYDPFETLWIDKLMMTFVFESMVYTDTPGWEQSATTMMQMPKSYLASDGAIALLDKKRPIRKADLATVCENRYARYFLIEWAFSNLQTEKLPKKYLKTDYLALVALEGELPIYPEKVELLEKRKIFVEGYQQMLYVYRFSYPGESEWRLGFSGPFPLKGMPEDFKEFALTGEDEDAYHPVRLEKQIKAWLRSHL